MYADRAYLEELARDAGLGEVATIAGSGLKYLETRTEFWRQQNPPDPDRAAAATGGASEVCILIYQIGIFFFFFEGKTDWFGGL
jgi:hypothetical protein